MDPEKSPNGAELLEPTELYPDMNPRRRQRKYYIIKCCTGLLLVALSFGRILQALDVELYWRDRVFGELEQPLQDDELSVSSKIRNQPEEWKASQKFCNIIGSAGDKGDYDGNIYSNWLEVWEMIAKPTGTDKPPKCAVATCTAPAEVGGHIVTPGVTISPSQGANGQAFLVPLCGSHNAETTKDQHLTAKSTITAVPLNNYCTWSGGSGGTCTGTRKSYTC